MIMGASPPPRRSRYHDAHCLAVPTHDGARPVSRQRRARGGVGGGGDPRPRRAQRRPKPPCARCSRRARGSRATSRLGRRADHRFRTPATVPTAVHRGPRRRASPRGSGGSRCAGRDASHVTLTLALEPWAGAARAAGDVRGPRGAGRVHDPHCGAGGGARGEATARLALAATRARENDMRARRGAGGRRRRQVTGASRGGARQISAAWSAPARRRPSRAPAAARRAVVRVERALREQAPVERRAPPVARPSRTAAACAARRVERERPASAPRRRLPLGAGCLREQANVRRFGVRCAALSASSKDRRRDNAFSGRRVHAVKVER